MSGHGDVARSALRWLEDESDSEVSRRAKIALAALDALEQREEQLQARLGICLGVMTPEQHKQAERYLKSAPSEAAS